MLKPATELASEREREREKKRERHTLFYFSCVKSGAGKSLTALLNTCNNIVATPWFIVLRPNQDSKRFHKQSFLLKEGFMSVYAGTVRGRAALYNSSGTAGEEEEGSVINYTHL